MADETNISLNNLNRFLTLLKAYIAEQISSGGITIDTEMSDTSENAVQNKVIKAYVDTSIGDKVLENNGCIVCSPTQPISLKKGLWIETDSNKDVNIVNNRNSFEQVDMVDTKSVTLNTGVSGGLSCAIDGKAYIFESGIKNGCIQCYDPVTDTITTKTAKTSSLAITSASSCAVDGKAYIFGGTYYYNGTRYTGTIQCYDPVTDTITNKSASLKKACSNLSSCAINGKAYIFGGYYISSGYTFNLPDIQCYDPVTDTITTKTAILSDNEYDTLACAVDGKAYIFGGNDDNKIIRIYDPITDTITNSQLRLSVSSYRSSCCVVDKTDECIYIFGGYDSNTDTDYVQCYNISTNICELIPTTLNTPTSSASSCAIDGKAYIFGGNGGNSKRIQCYTIGDMICKDESFANSIFVWESINEELSSKLIAVEKLHSSSNDIYNYKRIKDVYDINSDGVISKLPYNKIENYQVV